VLVGRLGGVKVFVCKTKQDDLETAFDVENLLAKLKESVGLVVAVGIAYGTDLKDQLLGDVLFADRCIHAAHGEVKSGVFASRGKIDDNALITKLNEILLDDWPPNKEAWKRVPRRTRPPKVHIGPLVSKPVLYNDGPSVSELLEYFDAQKPKGGDMELYQIASAAARHGTWWACIKSVSDFGGLRPKTDDAHALAAATAVDFAAWLLPKIVHLLPPRRLSSATPALADWLGCKPVRDQSGESWWSTDFVEGTRDWVFELIETWRANRNGTRARVFVAASGFGKTALAMRLAGQNEAVLASHFCRFDDAKTRGPREIIAALAYRIGQRLPDFKTKLEDLQREAKGRSLATVAESVDKLCDELLIKPLCAIEEPTQAASGRLLLVIDALDEVDDVGGSFLKLIAKDLPEKLPPWLALLATTRPDLGIQTQLKQQRVEVTTLDDDRCGEVCDEDLRVFCTKILKFCQPSRLRTFHLWK